MRTMRTTWMIVAMLANQNWLNACVQICTAVDAGTHAAVLITVAAASGSVPRDPGAKMVVTADAQYDTIGGGHLEYRAIQIARELLQSTQLQSTPQSTPRAENSPPISLLQRMALGPSLGQCCGGVVHLQFECIGSAQAEDFQRQLADQCHAWRPQLYLFGAGHVASHVIHACAHLPCRITWIDQREDLFPDSVPANVQIDSNATSQIARAAPGSSFLVMTHSHTLDQSIVEAVLRRNDSLWLGLIGSATKRAQFENRLLAKGIDREALRHIICPVGLPGISSKLPAVIAAAICAQLLQVWETAGHISDISDISKKSESYS